MPRDAEKQPLSPAAITLRDASRLLSHVGGATVTEEMLQADIEDGAPLNPDGTFNLVHYAAWLVKSLADGLRHGD
ncbi:MAG: hypothetical protein IT428_29685 [Planctomycetaceae bacterium]|nr:hypothetical protein [Planctomycetaceae bacterium]